MNNKQELKITSKGYNEMQKELKHLWKKRKEIIRDLKIAYDFGDLRENSEFDAAKQRQALCDKRIQKVEYILKHATIVNSTEKNRVDIGSKITIEYLEEKEQETYELVGIEEASITEHKISYQSPLGSAVIGKRENEIIKISSPTGEYQVKIIKIF